LPSLSPTADLPDATPLVTDASAGSYPAPQAQITLTPTALGYPGPESTPSPQSPSLLGAATSSPYPGPAPTVTPLQLATQTLVSTRLAAGTASVTVIVETPTPTLSPTVVRTIFQASNPADFRLVSDQHQLITFYATWAPDSDVMAPVIYNLAGRYKNRINFVYLNLDDAANSIFKEMLRSQLPPAFFLLDPQGNVIDSWFGRVSLQEMDNVLMTISP
jgi:thiol-disulfide isomerase/thioredoxin